MGWAKVVVKKRNLVLFIAIILLGSLLRLYKLDKVPPSLFSDEVDLGYQAYSFLRTGKDYFGNRWPISFHSFADFRAPFYIYSAAGAIAVFGMNEWGVRLPAAVFGIFGIIAFFFLIKEITGNVSFSLLATFFLTITPWHFHYSRAGFEATAIFFLVTFGFFLFFRSLAKKSPILLLLSLVIFSLGFYTYAIARMLLPMLAFVVLLIYGKEIFKIGTKKMILSVLVCFLILLPFLKDSLIGGSMHRFSYLNIFSDSNLKFEINRQRLIDAIHGQQQQVGMSAPFLSSVFHNKPLSWMWMIVNNYISSYSTTFLFTKGDSNLRQGIGSMGEVLVIFAPFLLLGLIKAFTLVINKKNGIVLSKEALFFLVFLFLSPIPSSITSNGEMHATRLFLMTIPIVFLIALGFLEFLEWFKGKKIKIFLSSILIVLIFLNFIYYLHLYWYHYPIESELYWHTGLKEGISLLPKAGDDYDRIIISDTYESPLVFFLFWSKFDPKNFEIKKMEKINSQWFRGNKIGKYYFGRIGTAFKDTYLPISIKNKKIEKILILAKRNDLGGDLEKDDVNLFKVIEKVYLPSNEPILYLVRTKTLSEYYRDLK